MSKALTTNPLKSLKKSFQATTHNLEFVNDAKVEGYPQPIPISGVVEFNVDGWAIDEAANKPASEVYIEVDGIKLFKANYGLKRPDIEKIYNADMRFTGFRCPVNVSEIGKGTHHLKIKIVSANGKEYFEPDYFVNIIAK
ncbi:MAG: hypothetical protein HW421_2774 [Ignavibacteria bacterium]|nr:hypothetical protein [Ignavibacteria bacterium]